MGFWRKGKCFKLKAYGANLQPVPRGVGGDDESGLVSFLRGSFDGASNSTGCGAV